MVYKNFERFCNSFQSGYVKPWKSFSIFYTLENDMPAIKEDNVRLVKYLENCLLMEGFLKKDIATIALYVELNGDI
jgi:hypothetical protein